MLEREESEKVLNAWGADIVKFAKINIGDKNRKRKSTLTGKTRKGKIDSSGKLRKSIDYELKVNPNSFGFTIVGEDYADVVDGGRRKGKGIPIAPLLKWVAQKPIRLRKDNKFIKMTDANKKAFAGFVSWKAKKYGIAPTHFLRDAVRDAGKKHEGELFDAYFKDVEQSIDFIINQLQANRIKIDLKF
jgi:hypothetical protein